jgi:hypothetical protein
LSLLLVITYLDRVCISVAGPRIQEAPHIGPSAWGWVTGVFTVAYAAFEIPSGALGDRIGPRRVLTRIVLWWSGFTSLTGMVTASFGGIPILFQTARLHGKTAQEKVAVYRTVRRGYDHVIGFELGRMFAPNGEIFDEETVRGLMEIPELKGMKHSSLDRMLELEPLGLRDKVRPDFRIYTGNDLGINMIEYGSDYLLGLASFAPEKFAERDRL